MPIVFAAIAVQVVALVFLVPRIAAQARARGGSGWAFGGLLVALWAAGAALGAWFGYFLIATEVDRLYEPSLGNLTPGEWLLLSASTAFVGAAGMALAFLALAFRPLLDRLWQGWNRFWFTPADPTLLGLIRIGCGLIVVYTLAVYSYDLQEFFGEHAWLTLDRRLEFVREDPVVVTSLFGSNIRPQEPQTQAEKEYAEYYKKTWRSLPPPPYPKNDEEAAEYDRLHKQWGFDPRAVGLPLPKTPWEEDYVRKYIRNWGAPPPPPYPRDEAEAEAFDNYRVRWGSDPRILYTRGIRIASIWFHVTDPTAMAAVHAAFILVAVLLTLGFCTRLTSALTWLAMLSYLHRTPTALFGVDTMMNIVLLYLTIGPSGAALSADRLIARWWAGARPRVLGRWRAFWDRLLRRSRPDGEVIAPGAPPPARPAPSVSANVAIRLLQIHVCIIYLAAGLAKLRGDTWWNGTAIWYTLANYEFAPMQEAWYMDGLRALTHSPFLMQAFLTIGTIFTLVFEIGYAFLIWGRRTRWMVLGMALMLHGVIGSLMGLKTFAFIMLVMNMAFLTTAEAYWLARPLRWLARVPVAGPEPATAPPPESKPTAVRAEREPAVVASTHVKRRR
jgi:hypothetical protein